MFLDPSAAAACANPDEDLVTPCFLVISAASFLAGLVAFPEYIVLDNEGVSRGAACFAADRAHCRHIVLSAARAAESNVRGMLLNPGQLHTFPRRAQSSVPEDMSVDEQVVVVPTFARLR